MHAARRTVRSTLAAILLLAGALTAAANIWGIRPINARLQTHVGPQVAQVLGREVCYKRVHQSCCAFSMLGV